MKRLPALLIASLVSASAFAVEHFEVEPNDTIEQATLVDGLRHGDRIAGNTFLNNDYYRLRVNDLAMGRVYMHTLTAAAAGNNNIGRVANEFRGVFLVSIGGSQNPAQAWENNPAFLKHRWYSFGGTTEVNLEMNSRLGSPAYGDYAVEYGQEEVEVADLGSFAPGEFTIRQTQGPAVGSFALYDREMRAVASGSADNFGNPFSVSRVLPVGEYTLVISAGTIFDPSGTFETRAVGSNALFKNGAGEPSPLVRSVEIVGGDRSITFDPLPSMRSSVPYGMAFARINVVPEPGVMGGMAVGLVAYLRTRRRGTSRQ